MGRNRWLCRGCVALQARSSTDSPVSDSLPLSCPVLSLLLARDTQLWHGRGPNTQTPQTRKHQIINQCIQPFIHTRQWEHDFVSRPAIRSTHLRCFCFASWATGSDAGSQNAQNASPAPNGNCRPRWVPQSPEVFQPLPAWLDLLVANNAIIVWCRMQKCKNATRQYSQNAKNAKMPKCSSAPGEGCWQ
jgi:hypothetical protein